MIKLKVIWSAILITALSSNANATANKEVILPKWLIIDLIEKHCSSPVPNPRVSAELEYDCSEKYEDAEDKALSMDYSLRLLPLFKDDFNQDGIEDIALEVESMGPLGGSVFTNSSVNYLILNNNKSIAREYEILLYAPFSEHIVEYKTAGKQIHYSAIPNYRAHPEAYEDGELIEPSIDFEIEWSNGVPVSSYYKANCKLADNKINKQIFTTANTVERTTQIDIHEYTQIIEEKTQMGNLEVTSEMSGCNERMISFYIKASSDKALPVLSEVIQALLNQTHYNKQLSDLLDLDKQSKLVFGDVRTLDDNWSGQIHINREKTNASIQINLYQGE